jgi:ribosomal protein S18 acetylase RimI-like enzyme
MDDQLIVGCLVIGWQGWPCHLYRLAVRPNYRRRAIGTALPKRAEERFGVALSTGCDRECGSS